MLSTYNTNFQNIGLKSTISPTAKATTHMNTYPAVPRLAELAVRAENEIKLIK